METDDVMEQAAIAEYEAAIEDEAQRWINAVLKHFADYDQDNTQPEVLTADDVVRMVDAKVTQSGTQIIEQLAALGTSIAALAARPIEVKVEMLPVPLPQEDTVVEQYVEKLPDGRFKATRIEKGK